MIESNLNNHFFNKSILLLGFGAEGQSSYELLSRLDGSRVIGIADRHHQTLDRIQELRHRNGRVLPSQDVRTHIGDAYLESLRDYDIILKSPGIPLTEDVWKLYGEKITSQTELFLKFFSGTTIGITGTKGKSSTSTLIYHILKAHKPGVHLLGNIGKPIFASLSEISPEDTVVLELSSHQLQHIRFAPNYSLLLNLYPEHLEYYGSFERYRDAKFSILQSGRLPNVAFVNSALFEQTTQYHGLRDFRWMNLSDGRAVEDFTLSPYLSGPHQKANLLFALQIAAEFSIPRDAIQRALHSASFPRHRTEEVGVFAGIRFINDSAATIPQATIAALQTFPDIRTLIVGGFDRGVNPIELVNTLVKYPECSVITLPETGHQIAQELKSRNSDLPIYEVVSLEDAVKVAKEVTPAGSTCLFSPAAASYHAYKNYGERGDHFITLVKE